MWTYHPELLATPVPRYTSYPTAAEFHDGVGAEAQAEGLAAIGADEPVSLYVHIPYCREICWYCGCNTGAANRGQRLAAYLDRLSDEIRLVAGRLDGRGRVIRVAFGGGSPNAIAPAQFAALAALLRSAFAIGPGAIWSVEIDPRGFDEPFAAALSGAGITRASLGVQTFDEAVQAAIGRIQPENSIARSVALLRGAGVTSLNMDLMYGLPGQDEAVLLDSIGRAEALGADRLAVFGYAHVPHLIPRQRRIDGAALPGPEARFRQAEAAHRALVANGWTAIGFDHFARPHDPLASAAASRCVRRNFQGFTDDPCETLIGLGASAVSRFPAALVQNEKNSGRYGLRTGNGLLAATRGVATPPDERRRGHAIERLLCDGAADLAGLPDLAVVRCRLAPFEQRGLARWSGTRLTLADGALPYARAISSMLDWCRADSTVRFSSAV